MTHPEPVAVVTGANRGIGLEVCRQLAGLGYAVVLGSRDLRKGRRAAARLGDAPNVTPCQLDVADDDSVRAAARWVAERFGRCDALVNNAAIHYVSGNLAERADEYPRGRAALRRDSRQLRLYRLDGDRHGRPGRTSGRRRRRLGRVGRDPSRRRADGRLLPRRQTAALVTWGAAAARPSPTFLANR